MTTSSGWATAHGRSRAIREAAPPSSTYVNPLTGRRSGDKGRTFTRMPDGSRVELTPEVRRALDEVARAVPPAEQQRRFLREQTDAARAALRAYEQDEGHLGRAERLEGQRILAETGGYDAVPSAALVRLIEHRALVDAVEACRALEVEARTQRSVTEQAAEQQPEPSRRRWFRR